MSNPIATITAMVIHPPDVNPCYGEDVIELRISRQAKPAGKVI